jgi:hypothetical protein
MDANRTKFEPPRTLRGRRARRIWRELAVKLAASDQLHAGTRALLTRYAVAVAAIEADPEDSSVYEIKEAQRLGRARAVEIDPVETNSGADERAVPMSDAGKSLLPPTPLRTWCRDVLLPLERRLGRPCPRRRCRSASPADRCPASRHARQRAHSCPRWTHPHDGHLAFYGDVRRYDASRGRASC